MIEPHSAQLGASSWILNATFVVPSDSVTVAGLPLPFDAGAAWPLAWPFVAMTFRSDAGAGGEEGFTRAASAGCSTLGAGCSVVVSARCAGASTATEPRGSSISNEVSWASDRSAGGWTAGPDDSAAAAGAGDAVPAGEPNGGLSTIADRSISPSAALSSGPRNREPSHRKM